MLLPETDPTGAFVLAEKIRLGVNAMAIDLAVPGSHPSISIGVVSYPADGRSADELMISADEAMYASKRGGKDRVTGVSIPLPSRRSRLRCSIGAVSDADPRPEPRPRGFSTRAIRAASRAPRVDQTPTSVPIYQTATFASADADELGRVAADPRAGYAYSRISNPTTTALGDAYAELAGGAAGLALASGMGAIHAALASLLRAGDRIVAPVALYGSTRAQLLRTFGGFGVRVDIVDTTDLDAVAAALAAAPTRVLYAETIANPTTYLADHAALAELAHRHGATYVVDNTFASPYVCRPLELGADLVVESATKFLGGHSDVIAGVVAGSDELIAEVSRVQIDTGATLGPLEAFLVLRGILTLAVRVERHARTAAALAAWLEGQDGVRSVLYPGPAEPSATRRGYSPVPPRGRRRDARLRGRRRP